MTALHDEVKRPAHYNSSPAKCRGCGQQIECIDITQHFNFCLGNVIKYVWRAEHKGGLQDLEKAREYLDYEIARRRKEQEQEQ